VQSIPPLHANRSVISNRANLGFIPATGLAPHGLAGCNAAVPWQATSPLFQSPRGEPFGPSATRVTYYTLCRLLPFVRLGSRLAQLAWVNSLAPTARQISRGKTRYLHCIDAEFTKCTPSADGGLRGHVPARPRCITPYIRFLFIAPQFRIGLPSDPASRRRPCPSPCLRLCENLAIGLSPTK
jgi:hypothetical protein